MSIGNDNNEPERVFTNWVDNLFACGRIGFSEMAIAKEMMYGWKQYLEESGVGKDETIWLTPEDKMADEESIDAVGWWDSPISGLDEYIIKRLEHDGITTNYELWMSSKRVEELFRCDKKCLKAVKEYLENHVFDQM